nr:protein NRT1/ PTR FAMILY 5.4-like [Ipomoea batatas]
MTAVSNGGDGEKTMDRKGGWKSAIFIIFVEMAERFSYYGVAGNLITYLTTVLGQPTATAARNVNTFLGVSALFPILGAFLADSYVGRFKTIVVSTTVYILTFAADQFDEDLPAEKEAKSSFFNWWYLGILVGATLAVLVVIYVEDFVGWTIGYGMLAAATVLALAVFLAGSRTYAREAPVGSPFTRVAHVVAAAVRKRRLSEERDGRGIWKIDEPFWKRVSLLLSHSRWAFTIYYYADLTEQDKATIIDDTDVSSEKRNPWRLCSVSQVEEVKLLLRLIPIWLSCLTFAAVIAQQGTFFTKQAATLDRSLGSFHFPPASFQVVTSTTILISVALYDRLLVPAARRLTGVPSGITVLQRIGAGLVLSAVTMTVAGALETKRLRVAAEHGFLDSPTATLPMPIWWLAPQYVLTGLGDVFTIVGLQELFYDQMPVQMRSTGAALYLSIVGVGNFLSGVLITIVQGISARSGHQWLLNNLNRSHLNYFYWLLAGLSAVNFCIYVFAAKAFVYKKVEAAAMEEPAKNTTVGDKGSLRGNYRETNGGIQHA